MISILLNKEKNGIDILLDKKGAELLIDDLQYLKDSNDHVHLAEWSGELTSLKLLHDDSTVISFLNIGVLADSKIKEIYDNSVE